MNQIQDLEKLKSIKRTAKFTYNFYRNIYIDKFNSSSIEKRTIYKEAIDALDGMNSLYQILKNGMRKKSVLDQIDFAKKWENFISYIDMITNYKTNEKYLKSNTYLDCESANRKAISIWTDYKSLSAQKLTNS